jgi:outer membrane biosynthesis protein TonB
MPDRNKNKKISLREFIRYRDNKMKGEERNAFERELQKDPFSKEASEGFASVTSQEASSDIHELRESLEKRLTRKKRFIIYRIAATIAFLMILSSLFLIIQIKRPSKQIALETGHTRPLDIARSAPIIEPAGRSEPPRQPAVVQNRKKEMRADKEAEPEPAEAIDAFLTNEMTTAKSSDSLAEFKATPEDNDSGKQKIVAAAAAGEEKRDSRSVATGNFVSFDTDRKAGDYLPPQPSGGKEIFDRYIRENLQWPDTSSVHQMVVVVLGFSVRTDGSVDSIKIIKSPGKVFSDEAIRLIRSGPAWKPAIDEGKPVEDQVRVRIVFN